MRNHDWMDNICQAPLDIQREHLNMLEETSLQLMRTSSKDIHRGNMGTYPPCKEQASSHKTKMERSMLNITYRDRKTNICIRKKTKATDLIEQVRSGPEQGTSAGYEITDGHCVSPPGNPMKGKDVEEGQRDSGEMN